MHKINETYTLLEGLPKCTVTDIIPQQYKTLVQPMSENTPDIPLTDSAAPPPQSQPVPPRTRPTAAYYSPPPYQPHHYQQTPPPRSSGCGKAAVFGLIILFVIGAIGVCTLVGTVFLFTVGIDAFGEISGENEEKTVAEKVIGGNRKADDKIAVLTISGLITGNAEGFIAKQIRRAQSDSSVKAVVIRVDSPGGTMSGSDYYLYLLKKMKSERKVPVVVSMGAVAASGGYYVSMIGDEIYAEPSTITGSIGVIASLYDASELFKMVGVASTPIVSGPHKAMGSLSRPMSEEERVIWQNLIDDNFDRFKQVIREGRKKLANNPEELDKLATGQVFTAKSAVENGLIDKIGYLDDAVKQAGKLANTDERDYKVVQYKPKLSMMDVLLEVRSPNKLLSEKVLYEVTTPKVYLICPYTLPVNGVE